MNQTRHEEQNDVQNTELDIANILKGIAFWEISVENIRLKLAEHPNFDIYHVWNKIDKQQRGVINTKQLQEFLSMNRIASSERETEMLMNINSNEKGLMDFNSFVSQILPQTNPELKNYALNRKEIVRGQQVQHFTSDIMVGSFSENQSAHIFGEELKYYREIEALRQNFARNHGLTTNQVFHIVDYKNTNRIDLKCVQDFFKKIGIIFGEDEFWALLKRTTNDNDDKMDYEELINAIMPREPFEYPAFRQEFEQMKCKQYVINKAKEFQVNVSPYSFGMQPGQERADPKDYHVPLRKVFNPYEQGKNAYYCDKGYMGQLKDYRDIYYNPNKDYNFSYKNEGNAGIRYHDSYMKDYYNYIYERQQNEQFFNKFGKRYQSDDKIAHEYNSSQFDKDKEQVEKFNKTLKMGQKFGNTGTINHPDNNNNFYSNQTHQSQQYNQTRRINDKDTFF